MKKLHKIEKIKTKDGIIYQITYKENDSLITYNYNTNEFNKFYNTLKQAIISDEIHIHIEDKELQTLNDQIADLNLKIDSNLENRLSNLESDNKTLQKLINSVVSDKVRLVENLDKLTEKKLSQISNTINEIKKIRDFEYENFRSREEIITNIANDLNHKQDITLENISDLSKELKDTKIDHEKFKKHIENQINSKIKMINDIKAEIKNHKDEVNTEIRKNLKDTIKNIKLLEKSYKDNINTLDKQFKEKYRLELKEKYFKSELNRRLKNEKEKKKFLDTKTNEIIKELKKDIKDFINNNNDDLKKVNKHFEKIIYLVNKKSYKIIDSNIVFEKNLKSLDKNDTKKNSSIFKKLKKLFS